MLLTIPKNSSRAITSAAGTADVVETITGVEFLPQKIKSIVKETNACLVWNGTLNLSPSDDKIIHVERILNLDVEPQLLASIMSKKISAGSNHVLIDIPFNGGKVKKRWQARKLGKKFRQIAKHFNIKLKAVYTDGRQPIGNGVGPILEMKDIIQVLQNSPDAPQDLKEKSIYLSIKLMQLCKIKNPEKKAREILESGQALEKFKQIVRAQDGKISFEKKVAKLKVAKFSHTIRASKSGLITKISNRKTNALCRVLGTPETKSAGVYFFHKLGKIKKGEKIFTMYSESKSKLDDGLRFLKEFELFRLE